MTCMNISAETWSAVTTVIHRFFWLIDHGRADEAAEFFLPDGRITYGAGAPNAGTIEGAAIKDAMIARAAMTHVTTRHVISNIVMEEMDAETISANWLLTLYRSEDGRRSTIPSSVADMTEIFRRHAAGWRILNRTVEPVFMRE